MRKVAVKSIAAKFESGLALRWYLSVKRGDLWAYCVSSMEIFFEARKAERQRCISPARVPGVLNDAGKLAARMTSARNAFDKIFISSISYQAEKMHRAN